MAIDQWYQRKQQDAEGEFYRKIAGQGPRNNFDATTQGFYVTDASGNLFGFNNNRGPRRLLELLNRTVTNFRPPSVDEAQAERRDPRYVRDLPPGASVVRVNAKVLGGYEAPKTKWAEIFQNSISRDNLWILAEEKNQLQQGKMPAALARRIARFHVVDNTRGEPAMWQGADIRALQIRIAADGAVLGHLHLETPDAKRGFMGEVGGQIQFGLPGQSDTFDLVFSGRYWGESRFTPNAPKGKFPFAVAFRLADGSDPADRVPPQGTKGWLDGYYR